MNDASVQEVYEGSGTMNEFQTPHRPFNCVEPIPFAAWGKTPVRQPAGYGNAKYKSKGERNP